MKKLIHYALNQPLFIVLGTLLFVMAGVIAFKNLSVEAFPDVTDTQVTVIALYPGRAAEEVEKQVTLPLETGLSGLPNSIRVFSHTQFGLSFTVIWVSVTSGKASTDRFLKAMTPAIMNSSVPSTMNSGWFRA